MGGNMGGKFGRGSWDQKFEEVQKGDHQLMMLLDQICLFGWVYILGDLVLV